VAVGARDPDLALHEALGLAFRQLDRRDRTELELRRHLDDKGVAPAVAERALEQLREQGYVDDVRFAQCFAEDRRLLDEWGAERIERRLAALGVEPEIAIAACAARDRDGELEAAVALLRRRFPALDEDPRERRRAHAVLVRKGYEPELAWDALRTHLAAPASRRAASSPAHVPGHATPAASPPAARRHPPG